MAEFVRFDGWSVSESRWLELGSVVELDADLEGVDAELTEVEGAEDWSDVDGPSLRLRA